MKKIIRYIVAGFIGLTMVGFGLTMGIPPSARGDTWTVVEEEAPNLLAGFAPLD